MITMIHYGNAGIAAISRILAQMCVRFVGMNVNYEGYWERRKRERR